MTHPNCKWTKNKIRMPRCDDRLLLIRLQAWVPRAESNQRRIPLHGGCFVRWFYFWQRQGGTHILGSKPLVQLGSLQQVSTVAPILTQQNTQAEPFISFPCISLPLHLCVLHSQCGVYLKSRIRMEVPAELWHLRMYTPAIHRAAVCKVLLPFSCLTLKFDWEDLVFTYFLIIWKRSFNWKLLILPLVNDN